MANTSSAKKANRVASRRRVFNLRRAKTMKDSVKGFARLLALKKVKEMQAALPGVYQAIDKAAKNNTISKNTAARMKSRITKRVAVVSK